MSVEEKFRQENPAAVAAILSIWENEIRRGDSVWIQVVGTRIPVEGEVRSIHFETQIAIIRSFTGTEILLPLNDAIYIEVLCHTRRDSSSSSSSRRDDKDGSSDGGGGGGEEEDGKSLKKKKKYLGVNLSPREAMWDLVRVGDNVIVTNRLNSISGGVLFLDRTPGAGYAAIRTRTDIYYIPFENVLLVRILPCSGRLRRCQYRKCHWCSNHYKLLHAAASNSTTTTTTTTTVAASQENPAAVPAILSIWKNEVRRGDSVYIQIENTPFPVQGEVRSIHLETQIVVIRSFSSTQTPLPMTDAIYVEILCQRRRHRSQRRDKGGDHGGSSSRERIGESLSHREAAWNLIRVGDDIRVTELLGTFPGRVLYLDRTPGAGYAVLRDESGITFIPFENVSIVRILPCSAQSRRRRRCEDRNCHWCSNKDKGLHASSSSSSTSSRRLRGADAAVSTTSTTSDGSTPPMHVESPTRRRRRRPVPVKKEKSIVMDRSRHPYPLKKKQTEPLALSSMSGSTA